MITHIRIQNLRSLVDTGFIEIKPLTILLGSNSSGKSTFLRSFPLFTQSVNKELREPISWFDDAMVDFGDYDTAKSKMAPANEGIKFSYKIKKTEFQEFRPVHNRTEHFYGVLYRMLYDYQVELSFQKDSKGGVYVNGVEYITKDLKIGFSVKEKNGPIAIYVNGTPLNIELKSRWKYGPRQALLPEFDSKLFSNEGLISIDDEIENYAAKIIKDLCRKNMNNVQKIYNILEGWDIDKEEYLHTLQNTTSLPTFKKNAASWDITNQTFLSIYNIMAAAYLSAFFREIDHEITSMYKNCSYIAPMRAAADRFYRSQSLQVQDVDPYGKNLPEFISSLSAARRAAYEEFTESVLGVKVTVENKASHLSIVLKGKNINENLTDVGFGYSQILPIITKLWFSSEMNKRSINYVNGATLMEQPELHLHPAMQARTIDIMMLVIKRLKIAARRRRNEWAHSSKFKNIYFRDLIQQNYSLIVETHSQAMINRIGKRIRENRFDVNDVSILLFEKDKETGETKIRPITYNEKGQLCNWPYGFFEPLDDDYDILFDKQSQDQGE